MTSHDTVIDHDVPAWFPESSGTVVRFEPAISERLRATTASTRVRIEIVISQKHSTRVPRCRSNHIVETGWHEWVLITSQISRCTRRSSASLAFGVM